MVKLYAEQLIYRQSEWRGEGQVGRGVRTRDHKRILIVDTKQEAQVVDEGEGDGEWNGSLDVWDCGGLC